MAKSGFLTEDNGTPSSMRLMSLVALITAVICAGYTLRQESLDRPIKTGTELTFLFLTAAFAPKALQKAFEEKLSGGATDNQMQTTTATRETNTIPPGGTFLQTQPASRSIELATIRSRVTL